MTKSLKLKQIVILGLALAPLFAFAFRDDFDGNALGGWWSFFSEGGGMQYEVGGGLLTVTHLGGALEVNSVAITAEIPGLGDYDVQTRLGWDEAEVSAIELMVGGHPPNWTTRSAYMASYRYPHEDRHIIASFALNRDARIPAPPNGMHIFHVFRKDMHSEAYFDGSLVLAEDDQVALTANTVTLRFQGSEVHGFAPLYVDYIQAVPEAPGWVVTLGLTLGFLLTGAAQRKLTRGEIT